MAEAASDPAKEGRPDELIQGPQQMPILFWGFLIIINIASYTPKPYSNY